MRPLRHSYTNRTLGDGALARSRREQAMLHALQGRVPVPQILEITAVLDWEWAHAGRPVEDIAWCEWIVRMHHPRQIGPLGVFFDANGGAIPHAPAPAPWGPCNYVVVTAA